VAGVAVAIFLITKSLFQIPAASFMDKVCGDKDDYWFLFAGMVMVSTLPLGYLLISSPLQLYLIQFLMGAATAFTFPSFMAIFTRYVEMDRAGTVWGVYYTLIDISSAATAAIGGVLAATIGFENVIIIVTVIGWIGALLYLPVGPALKKTPPCA
jgi:MFS family permease